MTNIVNTTPQLYGVPENSYASNWVHNLEAYNVQSLDPNQIYGLSTITVAPNIPYFGNTYCMWVTSGKTCKLSTQIDLDCSVGSIVWSYLGDIAPIEFRISCTNPSGMNLFPVASGSPILKCRIIVINTGQDLLNNSSEQIYDFYAQVLQDGTIALLYGAIVPFEIGHTPFTTMLFALNAGGLAAVIYDSFWSKGISTVGISICIEGSFSLK